MIVVRVELWSAITGKKSELARMHICNVGGSETRGDYEATVMRGRDAETLAKGTVQRRGAIRNYPRLSLHVWNLVSRALLACGYVEGDTEKVA